jgi:hypothetical protein
VRTAAVILSAIGIILCAGCKKPNHAPDTPAVPSGPTSCAVRVSYAFSSSAADPDGDSVAIRFDWGDGDTSEWSSYVPSGDSVAVTHSWSVPGTLKVKVQAKDRDSVITAWSSTHSLGVYHEWDRIFGRTGDDYGYSVQQTLDGGYVVVGYTTPMGSSHTDLLLVKVSATGDTLWSRTYGGALHEVGYSVQQTRDGGYIITGYTDSYGGANGNLWLIKTDATGDTTWTRVFGGDAPEIGHSVLQTQDGGYIVAGLKDTTYAAGLGAVWLIKTGANGDVVWAKTYGGAAYEGGASVEQTRDGGFVIAGYTESFGAGLSDLYLIKTDANGDTMLTRALGGEYDDWGSSVQQTQDGGYIIAGATQSYGAGDYDVWLVKTDANGDTTWTRTFGGQDWDEGMSVRATQDGGYIVAGRTWPDGGSSVAVWLIKTDAGGASTWTRTYGGSGFDCGNSVRQTQDGGYIIVGNTTSYGAGGNDVWLIKTGPNGEVDSAGGK